MSKLEANISLLIITFFASVLYAFLAGVPESVSHFAFMCITNLVGFLIALAFFFGDLFRLDSRQILQSIILSVQLVVYNLFMLQGVKGINTTVSAAVLSSYFVFIVLFTALHTKQLPNLSTVAGVTAVLAGLFLMTDANIHGLMNRNILYLIGADAAFALYVMTIGTYASNSNPSILAVGQMFFCFVFSLVLWAGEAVFFGADFVLPSDSAFWGSVIYTSFFIRGLYGVVQIYAQRYVTPLNTSLVFSTELIMTMAVSPLMTRFFGMPPESFTGLRITGSILIVAGLMITEPDVLSILKKVFHRGFSLKDTAKNILHASMNIRVILVSAAAYAFLDIPVQSTGLMPVHAGIKNFLPFTLGLFFGPSGVIGCCLGCAVSFGIVGVPFADMFTEWLCIAVTGMGMWYGWYMFIDSKRIYFREPVYSAKYMLLILVLSCVNLNLNIALSYIVMGVLIGLPVNILFGSLLGIEPVMPYGQKIDPDAEFVITSEPETLEAANESVELAGEKSGAKMKQVLEIQSCIEELSIRILKANPEGKICVSVQYGYAVSVKLACRGKKANPFMISKGEDIMDIMSLNIIKHRALRASYSYTNGENLVHVVV